MTENTGVGGVFSSYFTTIIEIGTTVKYNDDKYGKPPLLSGLGQTATDLDLEITG